MEGVSEGLNSVETYSLLYYHNVSKEFQKNLIVWKLVSFTETKMR